MKDHWIDDKRNLWRMSLREGASTVVLCILVLYSLAASVIILRHYQVNPLEIAPVEVKPSYLPLDIEDLYNYLDTPTATCRNYTVVEGAPILKSSINDTLMSGHEGTYICMDGLPPSPTPFNCRIYHFEINRYDIKFEVEMGNNGCRVHLITGATEYSFSEIGKNNYLYPIELAEETGPGKYTIDNFMDLMNHQGKSVHYASTTLKGAEWTFLKSLYKSEYKAYDYIKQIRLLVHLPLATIDAVHELEEIYKLFMGMPYYGYHIVYSRPIPGTTYTHATFGRDFASKYEVVWIKE
ncbi:unnamed protein product [Meganyctiphanes norvegica]|uniref:Uncharacterized protein n=1 Tax=Meganyctiphanes norvegica TaxID=48144 RepID=A0AAV2S2C0_MEGNR